MLVVLTAAQCALGPAFAQGFPAGVSLTFGINTELRIHDNFDLDPDSAGTTIRSDTRLSFELLSVTPISALSLTVNGVLRAEDASEGGLSTSLEDPGFDLSYTRNVGNSAFSFDAAFERSEVDGFSVLEGDGEFNEAELTFDSGTLDKYSIGAMLETGVQDPLGFRLELERRGTKYSGTTDPDLYDRTTDAATATAILRFSPVTEGTVGLELERFSAEDTAMTRRDTRVLQFGLRHEFSEITALEARVAGREIDDSVDGVSRGMEAGIALTHELPRGEIAVSFDTELTTAGRRNSLEVERSFTFPTGSLGVSLGVVDGEGVDPRLTGSLSYSRELPKGRLTASLARNVSVNSDSDIQQTTRATLGFSKDLSALSSMEFNLDYAQVSDGGGGGIGGSKRGTFTATYQRELTRDLSLSAGYQRRFLSEAGSGAAWDNAIFLTLGRQFSGTP